MPNEITHPLAAWRKATGTPQKDLATMLKVNRWTIFAIETGLRQPSPLMAKQIADMTGISKADLRPDLWDAA